ncbi:flagellar hook-associated protein 1 FlgK [Rubricella aquisinus]|uniref:Flagellar hook-associated protein 1 n=1 Tax=Rubricella aquisinus TaxID=2028108 RepID=A0A840X030_9RHOB|nr:flagellar hook-associated protein FlgK [Rubricella aquisinus]MBB5515256.1 flagellar hook-associated protein 1 FlgK [Rubricella aquisinus]
MSLSNALSLASAGLAASSKSAQVASENVANALTEGYARREVVRGPDGTVTTRRAEDVVLTAARRQATSGAEGARVTAEAADRIAGALGLPSDPASLSGRMDALDQALTSLISTPESRSLQRGAFAALDLAVTGIRDAASDLRAVREDADTAIGAMVTRLNAAIEDVHKLNGAIVGKSVARADTAALEDQRDRLIDEISGMIPLRVVDREDGNVALFSIRGAVLLDGRPEPFGFTPTATILPEMSQEGGQLSGLTLSGRDARIGDGRGILGGGALEAAFVIRDQTVPQATASLDAFAFSLADRLTRADASLAEGQPGALLDDGAALDPEAISGLAGRLTLNPALTDDTSWRLRDGIAAEAPGLTGRADQVIALRDALRTRETLPGGATSRDLATHLATLSAELNSNATRATRDADFARAERVGLSEQEAAAIGVDTDAELQALLLIERTYQANARVMQTVDQMFARLMEI